MIVQNDISIIKRIQIEQMKNPETEHCAFAYGIRCEYKDTLKMLESAVIDKYVQTHMDKLSIPRSVCVVFLDYCVEKGVIPIIYHTHGKIYKKGKYVPVDFSKQDMNFIKSFAEYAKNKKGITECAFAVIDGVTIKYCIINNFNYTYYYEAIGEKQNVEY